MASEASKTGHNGILRFFSRSSMGAATGALSASGGAEKPSPEGGWLFKES